MSEHCATSPQASDVEARQCECCYRPNVDIYEKADEIVILADLPGAAPDSIEIDYEDGELSLQAKVEPRQAADTSFLVREYGTGDYRRKFRVSEVVDAERIGANFANGVLTVTLPKVQAVQPRRISVNSG